MVKAKFRYLVVNIIYPPTGKEKDDVPEVIIRHRPTTENVNANDITFAIKREAGRLYGDVGRGMCEQSLRVRYWAPATSTLIIRISRSHVDLIRAAVALMTSLPSSAKSGGGGGGIPCRFAVLRVCGTISKAQQEIIRHDRRLVFEARAAMDAKKAGKPLPISQPLSAVDGAMEVDDEQDTDADLEEDENSGDDEVDSDDSDD